eukprot:CAMPEP_0182571748 /NCGR_PEP_ID=MMETSP1324-20130603/14631_1 /TAXON_ID=236786 /ORGANISM="Florenciella sp., Strain RCC1587" /LENGTH=44 /DNA_ID= /DNA_START= /DNA_END= /DNA_ORIENTATION=
MAWVMGRWGEEADERWGGSTVAPPNCPIPPSAAARTPRASRRRL